MFFTYLKKEKFSRYRLGVGKLAARFLFGALKKMLSKNFFRAMFYAIEN